MFKIRINKKKMPYIMEAFCKRIKKENLKDVEYWLNNNLDISQYFLTTYVKLAKLKQLYDDLTVDVMRYYQRKDLTVNEMKNEFNHIIWKTQFNYSFDTMANKNPVNINDFNSRINYYLKEINHINNNKFHYNKNLSFTTIMADWVTLGCYLTILSSRYARNLTKSEYELANKMIKENKKLNYKQFKNSISKSKMKIENKN